MRHRLSNNKLSRPSSQRKALLRNLVSDAIMYGRIKTTKAKAKEARPILEKMITLSKTKDFNSIRKVSEFITDKSVVDHLFEDFKISSIRHKFNLQKLANRAVHLYLTDEEFRKKIRRW